MEKNEKWFKIFKSLNGLSSFCNKKANGETIFFYFVQKFRNVQDPDTHQNEMDSKWCLNIN